MFAPSVWFIPSSRAQQGVGVLSQNAPTCGHQFPGPGDVGGVTAAAVGLELGFVIAHCSLGT